MKIIVAGEGAFGRKHLAALEHMKDIEIVSLCGGVAKPTEMLARAKGISHWSLDLNEM